MNSKALPNKKLKARIYYAIFIGHRAVAKVFGNVPANEDVSGWAVITTYCTSSFKMMLQSSKQTPGGIAAKKDDPNLTWESKGQQKPISEVYIAWVEALKVRGFDLNKPDDTEWIGSMSSILNLMNAFSKRMSEVRVAVVKFEGKLRKNADKKPLMTQVYGLDRSASVYMEGATYSPHIQSSLIKTLGPLAVCIGLSQCYDKAYADKWRNAVRHTWGVLPFVEELIDEIEGSGSQKPGIFSLLAQLCYFGVPRVNNKANIPFVAIQNIIFLEASNKVWAGTASLDEEAIEHLKIPAALEEVDSSGHGMWYVYNKANELPLTMRGPEGSGTHLGQLYMHAFLGTHKEDLSLIEWMCGAESLLTRSEMADAFAGNVGTKQSVKITTYNFSKICKLSSSTGTSLLSSNEGQIQRMAVMSGRCDQLIDNEHKILKILGEASATTTYRSRMGVVDHLTAIKEKLVKRVIKDKKLSWGNTKFYNYDASKLGTAYGTEVNETYQLKGKYFFGTD